MTIMNVPSRLLTQLYLLNYYQPTTKKPKKSHIRFLNIQILNLVWQYTLKVEEYDGFKSKPWLRRKQWLFTVSRNTINVQIKILYRSTFISFMEHRQKNKILKKTLFVQHLGVFLLSLPVFTTSYEIIAWFFFKFQKNFLCLALILFPGNLLQNHFYWHCKWTSVELKLSLPGLIRPSHPKIHGVSQLNKLLIKSGIEYIYSIQHCARG